MAKLTRDALLVQSILSPNESLPLHTIALRLFCAEEDKATTAALLRARRAGQILKERGVAEVREGFDGGYVIRSLDSEGNAGTQLQALMARVIWKAQEDV